MSWRTYENGMGVVRILSRPVRASTSWPSVARSRPEDSIHCEISTWRKRSRGRTDGRRIDGLALLQGRDVRALCNGF